MIAFEKLVISCILSVNSNIDTHTHTSGTWRTQHTPSVISYWPLPKMLMNVNSDINVHWGSRLCVPTLNFKDVLPISRVIRN